MVSKKKDVLKIGEVVVYPKHGVGEINSISTIEISNIKTKCYIIQMEQAKLLIRVPVDKQREVGLRKISSKKKIEEVFNTLKQKPKIKRPGRHSKRLNKNSKRKKRRGSGRWSMYL